MAGILDTLGQLQQAGAMEPTRQPLQINPVAATSGLGGILAGGRMGRAKAGGETSDKNNYFYKGGQFLPNTEAPPGTWRIKFNGRNQNIPNGQELIEPGQYQQRPTPFSRSIYQVMGAGSYVNIGPDGKAAVNPNVNWDYLGTTPDAKSPVRFKNLAESKDQFSTNDLVDMYNKGVRWIDIEALPGVGIIDKK